MKLSPLGEIFLLMFILHWSLMFQIIFLLPLLKMNITILMSTLWSTLP